MFFIKKKRLRYEDKIKIKNLNFAKKKVLLYFKKWFLDLILRKGSFNFI